VMNLNKLKEHLASEEGKAQMRSYFDEIAFVSGRQFHWGRKLFGNLEGDDLDVFLKKFFEWERAYEDKQYAKGVISSSNIWSAFLEYVAVDCDPPEDIEWEDFLADYWDWKGYRIKLFQGQGCFCRVEKDNKEIFQTT